MVLLSETSSGCTVNDLRVAQIPPGIESASSSRTQKVWVECGKNQCCKRASRCPEAHTHTHTKDRTVMTGRQQQNPGGMMTVLSIYDLEGPRAGVLSETSANNCRRGRRDRARDGEKGAVDPSKRSRPDCSVEGRDGGAGGRTLWIGGFGGVEEKGDQKGNRTKHGTRQAVF